MKNLKFIILFFCIIFISGALTNVVKAEEQIAFSPTQIIVKETDLGKKYTITISNSTSTDYNFTVEEKNVKKTNDTLDILDSVVTTRRLEIPITEFKVKANSKFELIVRVKIFTNESFESFPALLIKEKSDPKNQLKVLIQSIIPFIVQNTKGESKIESVFSINAQNYTIDPKLTIIGKIDNSGTKFSNLSGTIQILKNGKIIDEKEITSQISGLFFPTESRNYSLDWTINQDYFDGLGEYTVESRINNDETNNVSVMKISFIYIPKNLLITIIGSFVGIALLITVFKVIKKSRQK